jgi:hypothetical protein
MNEVVFSNPCEGRNEFYDILDTESHEKTEPQIIDRNVCDVPGGFEEQVGEKPTRE